MLINMIIEIIFGVLIFFLYAAIYGHKISMDNIIERLEEIEKEQEEKGAPLQEE